ncbi:hypothetical protein BESB_035390 [Besnoitia besnoiti]|uniref:Uncharacterized protein n=1 Tax=Besnoitia besnoiti TaxID=94643 RepID=A0A2A9ML92_BESBE|nr:hypothetical protein BESB_035390 [Besnoitia besnoiti]PFH37081.1 hypothetical protein BESB_035390 [Besnoitia besnoiti]
MDTPGASAFGPPRGPAPQQTLAGLGLDPRLSCGLAAEAGRAAAPPQSLPPGGRVRQPGMGGERGSFHELQAAAFPAPSPHSGGVPLGANEALSQLSAQLLAAQSVQRRPENAAPVNPALSPLLLQQLQVAATLDPSSLASLARPVLEARERVAGDAEHATASGALIGAAGSASLSLQQRVLQQRERAAAFAAMNEALAASSLAGAAGSREETPALSHAAFSVGHASPTGPPLGLAPGEGLAFRQAGDDKLGEGDWSHFGRKDGAEGAFRGTGVGGGPALQASSRGRLTGEDARDVLLRLSQQANLPLNPQALLPVQRQQQLASSALYPVNALSPSHASGLSSLAHPSLGHPLGGSLGQAQDSKALPLPSSAALRRSASSFPSSALPLRAAAASHASGEPSVASPALALASQSERDRILLLGQQQLLTARHESRGDLPHGETHGLTAAGELDLEREEGRRAQSSRANAKPGRKRGEGDAPRSRGRPLKSRSLVNLSGGDPGDAGAASLLPQAIQVDSRLHAAVGGYEAGAPELAQHDEGAHRKRAAVAHGARGSLTTAGAARANSDGRDGDAPVACASAGGRASLSAADAAPVASRAALTTDPSSGPLPVGARRSVAPSSPAGTGAKLRGDSPPALSAGEAGRKRRAGRLSEPLGLRHETLHDAAGGPGGAGGRGGEGGERQLGSRRGSVDSTVSPEEWRSLIPADIYDGAFSLTHSSTPPPSTPQQLPSPPPELADGGFSASASTHQLPLSPLSGAPSSCVPGASPAEPRASAPSRSAVSPADEAAALRAVLAALGGDEDQPAGAARSGASPFGASPGCLGASRTLSTFFEHLLAVDVTAAASSFVRRNSGSSKPNTGLPPVNATQRLHALQRLCASLTAALHVHQALRLEAGMRVGGTFSAEELEQSVSSPPAAGPYGLEWDREGGGDGRGPEARPADKAPREGCGVWRGGVGPQNLPIFLRVRQEQYLQQRRDWSAAFPDPYDDDEEGGTALLSAALERGDDLRVSGERGQGEEGGGNRRLVGQKVSKNVLESLLASSPTAVLDCPHRSPAGNDSTQGDAATAHARGADASQRAGGLSRGGKGRDASALAKADRDIKARALPLFLQANATQPEKPTRGAGMDDVKTERADGEYQKEGEKRAAQKDGAKLESQRDGKEHGLALGFGGGEGGQREEHRETAEESESPFVPNSRTQAGASVAPALCPAADVQALEADVVEAKEQRQLGEEREGERQLKRKKRHEKGEKKKKKRILSAEFAELVEEGIEKKKKGRGKRVNAHSECSDSDSEFSPEEESEDDRDCKRKRQRCKKGDDDDLFVPPLSRHVAAPPPDSSADPPAPLPSGAPKGEVDCEERRKKASRDSSMVTAVLRKREKKASSSASLSSAPAPGSAGGSASRRGDEAASATRNISTFLNSSRFRIPRKKTGLLDSLLEEAAKEEKTSLSHDSGTPAGSRGAEQGPDGTSAGGKRDSRQSLEEIDPWSPSPPSPPHQKPANAPKSEPTAHAELLAAPASSVSVSYPRPLHHPPPPPPPPAFLPHAHAFGASRYGRGPPLSTPVGPGAQWGDRAQRAGARAGDGGGPSGDASSGGGMLAGPNRTLRRERGNRGGTGPCQQRTTHGSASFWSANGSSHAVEGVRGLEHSRGPPNPLQRGPHLGDSGGAKPPAPPPPPPPSSDSQFLSRPPPHSLQHAAGPPSSAFAEGGGGISSYFPSRGSFSQYSEPSARPLGGGDRERGKLHLQGRREDSFEARVHHHVGYQGRSVSASRVGAEGPETDEEEEGQVSDDDWGAGDSQARRETTAAGGEGPPPKQRASGRGGGHLGYRGVRAAPQRESDEKEEGEEEADEA